MDAASTHGNREIGHAEEESMRNWHRLFGLALIDYFLDSPYVVELETDLSVIEQLLDVVIIEQVGCRHHRTGRW